MVSVLRLGHRIERDKRLTTHCALVSRAFGAEKMFYTGDKDSILEESVKKISRAWGGDFVIEYVKDYRKLINQWKGKKIHLTMYGIPFQKKIENIRKERNVLLIVGGEKVPGEIYHLSDWNMAITNQPHSEVSSLAVFVHEYFQGKELNKKFRKARRKIVPQERGKKVVSA